MLDAETRQRVRQLTEGMSSTLSDDERARYLQLAKEFAAMLREFGCSDEAGYHVARLIARMMGTLQATPLQDVSRTIDANLTAYSFTAGALAGVYALPEREGETPAPEFAPSTGPSPYL